MSEPITPNVVRAFCPVCGSPDVIRLPDDWQEQVNAGKAIPIIACGNPWHYAKLDDANPAPLDAHKPGDFHRYHVACKVCGEPGYLRVSWDPERTALEPKP